MGYHKWNPLRFLGALDIHGVLALSGVVGPFVLILSDLIPSFSQPGYSFVRDSISSLAVTSMGWIQTIGFLAIGLLVEIFAAGLFLNIRRRTGFGLSIGLLACFGFGLLLIGAFRTDPVESMRTVEDTIHGAASGAVFWLFLVSLLLLLPSLRGDPRWQVMFNYTVVTSVLALALIIGRQFLPDNLSWFGLYERILVGSAVVWVEAMAIRLLFLSFRRQREAKPSDDTSPQSS